MNSSNAFRQGYLPNNEVRLVKSGSDYFDLLEELINRAKHTIHLQIYIFEEDETGKRVAQALLKAAERKVRVYVIADGYASQNISSALIDKFRKSGVYFRFFGSYFRSKYFYFGRRMHHKLLVVDARYALVGGINIGDHYNDTAENVAWLDWAVYVQGDVGVNLQHIAEKRIRNSSLVRTVPPPQRLQEGSILVRHRINDWVRRKREITQSYLEMLQQAHERVTLVSSYFIPGKLLKRQLADAVKRGVQVRVIQTGISDVTIAKYAERYMYRWFLRHGIEIWEYQRKVLHGKLATYDRQWVTVGSYNLNNISAYASVELNLDIANTAFATAVDDMLDQLMQEECIRITPDYFQRRQTLWEQILQRSAFDIFRLVLFLFTFYFKQRD